MRAFDAPHSSSICIIDMSALQTIPFLYRNGFPQLQASPCWHRNRLARTESVLAYGHHGWRGWLMASTAGLWPCEKNSQ